MNSGDDTASPKTQDSNGSQVSAPSDMDLQAINQAIAESADEAVKEQNSFDVNDISLDNTPTTDAELKAQMDKDPNMSLAGGQSGVAPASSIDTPSHSESKVPSSAGFVDGDLENEPEESVQPEEKPDYAAREADPVESFDENAPTPTSTDETKSDDATDSDSSDDAQNDDSDKKDDKKSDAKKKQKKSSKEITIDFDAIIHNNFAVAGIVVVAVAVIVDIVLLITLNS